METKKKNSNVITKRKKYRITLYLGKELYSTLLGASRFLNMPLATFTRILLETGVNVGNALDKHAMEGIKDYVNNESKI